MVVYNEELSLQEELIQDIVFGDKNYKSLIRLERLKKLHGKES